MLTTCTDTTGSETRKISAVQHFTCTRVTWVSCDFEVDPEAKIDHICNEHFYPLKYSHRIKIHPV